MQIKILFLTVIIWSVSFNVFASNYEIVELRPHKDSITFDPHKKWYIVIIEEPIEKNDDKPYAYYYPLQEQVTSIDLANVCQFFRKDSIGYSDSLYYFKLTGDFLNKNGKFLIGTTDSLKESICRYYDFEISMNIGYRMELTYQGIRDYSPYINLNIVGETILKDHEIKTNSYELIIDCDFDSHAYYEVTSFGNNRITSRSSFTQSLNLLVHEHLKNNYNKKKPYFKFSRVIHIGYIDKDGIMDLILEIKGMRYLFLSNKHDFETKTIFHLEKVWRVENYVEF